MFNITSHRNYKIEEKTQKEKTTGIHAAIC